MELDTDILSLAEIEAINAQASIFMKEGIRLMDAARPGVAGAALACFDRALALRRRLPVHTSPMLRYGLAACWINRADALMRSEASERAQSAIRSYDEAVTLLRDLPLDEDARFARRLAIAFQNRGLALQHTCAIAEALDEFSKAIEILEHERSAAIADRLHLLAAVWVNLANAELAQGTALSEERAAEAARRAIALVADLELKDAHTAEVGIKARHVLCQTIARRLSQPPDSNAPPLSEVHDATDAADDGLALVRLWEHKSVDRFRNIALDFFRFGMRVYARYQPQFLAEFLSENMDPVRSSSSYVECEEMRSGAREGYELISLSKLTRRTDSARTDMDIKF